MIVLFTFIIQLVVGENENLSYSAQLELELGVKAK
jgi:hypothetical protein